MKKIGNKVAAFIVAIALFAPVALLAQDDKKDKAEKEVKEEKTAKEKKDVQQVIITRKGDKDEKVVVEIVGDKITINGKSIDEYKGKDGDISVRLNKVKDMEFLTRIPSVGGTWNYNGNVDLNNNYRISTEDANKAMLGVTTEHTNEGAEINSVTKESAAEKIGLKEGDIITKVGDKKIEGPDDLSAAIKGHKPGDKVTVTYLRDKKENTATAELTKWKGVNVFGANGNNNFKMEMDGMDLGKGIPRALTIPRSTPGVRGQAWSSVGATPKLGLSVQDTDDGKGVKVIEVDDESNAKKAGIKEDDVVTEVDGKAVNSTDDMVKMIKESKDKTSIMVKLQRGGKTQNIEVKMPRKIKTADL